MAKHSLNSAFTITVDNKTHIVEKIDENEHVILFTYMDNNSSGPDGQVTIYTYDKKKQLFISSVTVEAEYGQAKAYISAVVSEKIS